MGGRELVVLYIYLKIREFGFIENQKKKKTKVLGSYYFLIKTIINWVLRKFFLMEIVFKYLLQRIRCSKTVWRERGRKAN